MTDGSTPTQPVAIVGMSALFPEAEDRHTVILATGLESVSEGTTVPAGQRESDAATVTN